MRLKASKDRPPAAPLVTTPPAACPQCGLVSDAIRCPRCNALKLASCAGGCAACGSRTGCSTR